MFKYENGFLNKALAIHECHILYDVFIAGLSPKVYLRQLGYSFLVQCAGCVASLISVTMVAIVLDAMGKDEDKVFPYMATI